MSDESFERWLDQAESFCIRRTGLNLDSLGDGPSWDAWNDGVPPVEYGSHGRRRVPAWRTPPARRPETVHTTMHGGKVLSNNTLNLALAQRLGHMPKLY